MSALQRIGGAELVPRSACRVDSRAVSDELSRALRARRCWSTESTDAAAVYIVSDPNKPGRRVLWCSLLKGAFVVTGRASTDPADARGPVVKHLPAT